MSNLTNLKRQHKEVLLLIKNIETLSLNDLELFAKDIAYNINALSGKLKMHLVSEDKYLYPDLMNSHNKVVKETAQKFSDEMGDLASLFQSFVCKFNVPSKILQNKKLFINDSKRILDIIKRRIKNEDKMLYPLIEHNK